MTKKQNALAAIEALKKEYAVVLEKPDELLSLIQ